MDNPGEFAYVLALFPPTCVTGDPGILVFKIIHGRWLLEGYSLRNKN